jgi:hypothetical protein
VYFEKKGNRMKSLQSRKMGRGNVKELGVHFGNKCFIKVLNKKKYKSPN